MNLKYQMFFSYGPWILWEASTGFHVTFQVLVVISLPAITPLSYLPFPHLIINPFCFTIPF